MLKALFRVRLLALQSALTGAARSKKTQSKGKLIGFALLMIFSFLCFASLFWTVFTTIAQPFHAAGIDWLFFSMAALMGFALMFVGSVFTSKTQLYEARDNDLLLSLPIKPWQILLSRMFMLWLIAFALELVVAVPALAAWEMSVGFMGTGLVWFVLIFILLLPFLALALSALLGWVLSVVTAKMGNKSLVTVVLSVIFLVAYMYFAAQMNTLLSQLAMNPDRAAAALGAVALLKWIGDACAVGSASAGLMTAGVIAVCFGAVYLVLSLSFVHTATDRRGGAKKKYVARREKLRSPESALFGRELKRLLSSPGYLLNCGLGAFLAPIGAVALLIKGGELLSSPIYLEYAYLFQLMMLAGLCFFPATILVTAPSVSLEGKSLWIARSLPVSTRAVLSAKLRLHCAVCLPPLLIAAAVVSVLFRPGGLLLVYTFALPVALSIFVGLLGLMENLRHPNLDYVNETQAVKSGAAVMITMFAAMGIDTVAAVGYVFLSEKLSFEIYGGVLLLLLAAASLLLHRRIMTKGVRLFEEL